MACGVAPAVSTINPSKSTTMTKSKLSAALFYAGATICGIGTLGLLCGISHKANAVSAVIAMVGMAIAYTAARYIPKRPAQ